MSALLDSLAGAGRRATCTRHTRHVVATVDTRVDGIPCRAEVTHFLRVQPFRGSAWHCDSPEDYFGYSEIEFDIVDRRDRPAPWLEKKLTAAERERIEREIVNHMEQPE